MGLPFVWDYDIDEEDFVDLLDGKRRYGRLDRDWAAIRLLNYAPYSEIIRLLGFKDLMAGWPKWRDQVRSPSRRRGFDFLVAWLPDHEKDWES